MARDRVTLLEEEFENDKSGEKVKGVTSIIDGKLKQALEMIISNNQEYNNYSDVVRDALFEGINKLIDNK